MDQHIKEFYRQFSDEAPEGRFHRVIALHEVPDLEWESIHHKFPVLCKGWYELTHLKAEDRIEFTRDYWLSKLPYHPKISQFLGNFFDSLDDVCIYLFQQKYDDPFEVNIVYSLKGNNGFFRGNAAASEDAIEELKSKFPGVIFPDDYLAFLLIHNGFWKTTDCTGLIKTESLFSNYQQFQETLSLYPEPLTTTKGLSVNPKRLIPFYESFGMPFYQCFWMDWYPEQEMGNVYFSGSSHTISDVSTEFGSDSMAFPSFIDWLIFYLERIE